MAKRKRLTLPGPVDAGDIPADLETKSAFPMGVARMRPPIAATVGEDAAASALREVTERMEAARRAGRFVQEIPLDQVETGYLARDRVAIATPEDADMEALVESLRARGQQTPIEVVRLDPSRFGLISGWRRLQALRRLHTETGEARFGIALAVERSPDTAAEAYVAMVEENEIRVGLSHYERARVVAKAVEHGVFETEKAALGALFAAGSRARRSKIKSFLPIVAELDTALAYPTALPERLGLRLSRALEEDRGFGARLRKSLAAVRPASPEAELSHLAAALAGPKEPAQPRGEEILPGLRLEAGRGTLKLSGPAMTPELAGALRDWLQGRAG
jgi:ParB-like chromosome segregation protein Spo0J